MCACTPQIATCKEQSISFNDLPSAVQETAKRESQGAKVRGYAKEMDKGKTEYEVQLLVAGKSKDIAIDPEGKVLETEQEVALNSIPKEARSAITQKAQGAKVERVEQVKSEKPTVYEALIHKSGKKQEIRVLENGDNAPAD
jgi:hypothetical protein